MPKLKIDAGPAAGKSLTIDREIVVGRSGADLSIEDSELSRRHVAFRPVPGGIEIEDLRSTNGTFVDGRRIDGALRVTADARVSVGQSVLSVQLPAAGPAVTARRAVPVAAATAVTRPRATAHPVPPQPLPTERSAAAAEDLTPGVRGGGPLLFEERSTWGKVRSPSSGRPPSVWGRPCSWASPP